MKARIFEIPACATALLTEHVEGIEELFEIDKEIMVFDTPEEMIEKARFLQSNPNIAIKLGQAGQKRYLKEHTSKIRLRKILNQIKKL
jgi:spore maturation protein CgeB